MNKRDALLLLLAVGIIIGYSYGLDTPQALQIPLREQPYRFTSSQFNLIYFATFSLIGFLVIPIGVIIDRYPIKKTLMVMLLALLVSHLVISIMFQFTPPNYLWVILVMRSVFGLAGEGLYTAQCMIMSLFAESEYEFLAGLALSLPFAFDALNSVTTTAVYDSTHNLPLCWYIGVGVCLVSLGSGVLMNQTIIKEKKKQEKQKQEEIKNNPKSQTQTETLVQQKKGGYLKELKMLDKKFWVVAFFVFFCEASLGPFNDNLNQLIVSRFNFKYTDAGKLLLIPFTALCIFTLICGWILKKKPHLRRISMLVSTANYMVSHFTLYFLPNTTVPQPYHYLLVIYFLFSMAFNFAIYYVSITTSISFMAPTECMGTAWGVAGSAIGFSQCLVPLIFIAIIGTNTDLSAAYKNLSGAGVFLSVIPVCFAMWINYFDYDVLDVRYADADEYLSKKSSIEDASTSSDGRSSLEEALIDNQVIVKQ